jgi:primosomal protein N' (replication factor Y) (superfamily II helicase)
MSRSLFGEMLIETGEASRVEGPFASVALETTLDKTLDYAIPPKFRSSVRSGQRVRVPLGKGNKSTFGWVVDIHETSDYPRIKSLIGIEDERILVTPAMMELARWISRYYFCPLGTVLESVIPSAVKKRIGVGYLQIVRTSKRTEEIQELLERTRARKQRAVLGRLLQLPIGEGIEIHKLAEEAGTTVVTVRKLAKVGVISITSEAEWLGLDRPGSIPSSPNPIVLNEDQQRVFDELIPRVRDGKFSVNLLFGVTGSGKTEIYLRCLGEILPAGKTAIIMVPEIALTPQTVQRFTARFPDIAVLHSGMSQTQRHRSWQQIFTGKARIVVGARSAIFAPLPNLGLIVVDEEHESTYKQETAPRYHGRDVAIKRAQLESCPILLGSATPSLEMWENSRDKGGNGSSKYHLLTLPHRVRGLALPTPELIDLKVEAKLKPGVHLISTRLAHLLRHTIDTGKQAILLLNRRGYSNFVYCVSCQEPIHCKYCDTTMTYHRSTPVEQSGYVGGKIEKGVHTGQLHCHYCLAVSPLPAICPTCGKKLTLFGLGTQRVEEEIRRLFPNLKYARVDSDTMRSSHDYETILRQFSTGEIQVLLGTQMIAKGLDYPNVTLVGVISADTALALPDFRSAERTFQLITQVAGRAGRGDSPGRVLVQTFLPTDPTIQLAIKQDYPAFAERELASRRQVDLPPFARMVRIVIRDEDQEKLHKHSEEIAALLNEKIQQISPAHTIRLRGPMPAPIARIAGYFRNQIVMQSPRAESLQELLALVRSAPMMWRPESVAVDVDPISLL